MAGRGTRRVTRLGGIAALTVMSGFVMVPAFAEGSAQLYSSAGTCQPNSASGACRASLEWRTNTYGPAGSQIVRRTLVTVFARAGEVLEMGSSAVGVGTGDIVVWNPGQITDQQAPTLPVVTSGTTGFVCSVQRAASGVAAQGRITSRALELAGPRSADGTGNIGGYIPCTYTAPSTGLYSAAFYGPAGPNAAADGGPTGDIGLVSANNFNASQGSSVAAWDVTVRANAASTTDLNGRAFTYGLAEFTAGNGRPVFHPLYVTTSDGYRYRLDTRGLDPNGFIVFGSRYGFLDPDGTMLDHDVTGNAGGSAMSGLDGNTGIAPPSYPESFGPLAAATLTALGIATTPTLPTVSGLSFAGNLGSNNSTVSGGGTFHYTSNVATTFELVVSRDGTSFDPGDPANAVLLGQGHSGANSVPWNGRDESGAAFPVGTGYRFRLTLHAGEYHFPELDAESSTLGGPTVTLLNPPGGTCPFGRPSCTTAFYDDRGYPLSTGTDVGTPGALLCGTNPPTTDHANPVSGYDSAGAQRAYGTDTGGNTNVSCTGSFGDVKGLDTWTYFPSSTTANTLNILSGPPTTTTAPPTSTPTRTAVGSGLPATGATVVGPLGLASGALGLGLVLLFTPRVTRRRGRR